MKSCFENAARKILEEHGCKLIKMLTETICLWENKKGIVRSNDYLVFYYMTDEAWDFWANTDKL